MKFEDAKLCVLLNRLDLLSRKRYVEEEYKKYKKNLAMNGITASDVIIKNMKKASVKWTRNDFPYDVENTRHYLVWSTAPLEMQQIDEITRKRVNGREYLRFVNPVNLRSVKDLWHAHVLVKM